MKTYKLILSLLIVIFVSSCSTQEKTVRLANGKMITEKQSEKNVKKALRQADRYATKAVKGEMTRKQIREFKRSLNFEVVIDTIN